MQVNYWIFLASNEVLVHETSGRSPCHYYSIHLFTFSVRTHKSGTVVSHEIWSCSNGDWANPKYDLHPSKCLSFKMLGWPTSYSKHLMVRSNLKFLLLYLIVLFILKIIENQTKWKDREKYCFCFVLCFLF